MKTVHAHTRARSWVLNLLYGWEIAGGDGSLEAFAERALSRRRIRDRYLPHVRRLLLVLDERMPEVDASIRSVMSNWRLERLTVIDRNILRIGTAEILHVEEVPPKVAIHEAIRLAERYGGKESPAFVNGVLDAVYRGTLVES